VKLFSSGVVVGRLWVFCLEALKRWKGIVLFPEMKLTWSGDAKVVLVLAIWLGASSRKDYNSAVV